MSEFDIAGTGIYYERFGAGPDLVFVHGYTCNLEDWRTIANALAGRYQVLLFDLRCHGRSAKTNEPITLESLTEDMHALLNGLGIKSPVVIGHSLGGMMALEYGLRYPSETGALVLAEGHTHIDTTARIIGSGVLDGRTPPAVAATIEAEMGQGAAYVGKSLFDSLLAFDVRSRVAELKMPILFLWGDRYGDLTDPKLPEILQEFGFRDMPNLTARYIHNSHHFLTLEQPQETLQAIEDFLRTL